MLPNPSLPLLNLSSAKNPKSGPQRIKLATIWDKNEDQRNSLWVVFSCFSACYPRAPISCQTLSSRSWAPAPTPGGMSSRSKRQFSLPWPFSPQNNLLILHPYPSTQIGFCFVLWSIFFFPAPHLHATTRTTEFTLDKWPSDPITDPNGEHPHRCTGWDCSVTAQPRLCCEAASLPFGFQCVAEESSKNGAHPSVQTEELCFGTGKTVNPLGKQLELGGTAWHLVEPEMVIFYKEGIVQTHSWMGSVCLSHFTVVTNTCFWF